jgi:hypothetical protein
MSRRCLFLAALWLILTGIGGASIIQVPDDYQTIQAGVDAAGDGDTILVSPGTYHEIIVIQGHSRTLASRFLTTGDSSYIESTIIDGDSLGSVVSFKNWGDPASTLCGFTITDGGGIYGGGGVNIENGSVVMNNIIEYNSATRGGGVYSVGNSIIKDNIIRHNYVTVAGGGIITYGGSNTFDGNIISDNTSEHYGGGIHIETSQYTIITNNIIINNSSPHRGGGVIFYTEDQGGDIIGNLIAGNSSSYNCGLGCNMGTYNIINNTIANNSGPEYSITVNEYATATMVNNIIWNFVDQEFFFYDGSTVTVSYSDIRGGYDGIGNIDSYPMFADSAAGDFHLAYGSPCIDTGDPDSPLDPDSSRADMGAFYFDHLTGIDNPPTLPSAIVLYQNYPNPFNQATVIPFDLDTDRRVSLEIYDILGKRLMAIDAGRLSAGRHQLIWTSDEVASGSYFYRLSAGDFSQTKKLTLLK